MKRLTEIERRLEEGLNQNDTSVSKMREKIEQLEHELAQVRQSSNIDRLTRGSPGTSAGEGVSDHSS